MDNINTKQSPLGKNLHLVANILKSWRLLMQM